MEYVLIGVILVVAVFVIGSRLGKEKDQTEFSPRDNSFMPEAIKEGLSAVATAQMAAEMKGVEGVPYDEPEKYERAKMMMSESPEVAAVVLSIACGLTRKYAQSNNYREYKAGLLEFSLQRTLANMAGIDSNRIQSLQAAIDPAVRERIEQEAFERGFQYANGIRGDFDEARSLLSAIESAKQQ